MKIYRISQDVKKPIDPNAIMEVSDALNKINNSVAVINKSLNDIESTGIDQLFQRENLIEAIQSGDLSRIDVNKVDQALNAMQYISQAVPIINSALRVINDNAEAAKTLNLDIQGMQGLIISSLQSGNWSQFQSTMSNFQTQMGSMSGTSAL